MKGVDESGSAHGHVHGNDINEIHTDSACCVAQVGHLLSGLAADKNTWRDGHVEHQVPVVQGNLTDRLQ